MHVFGNQYNPVDVSLAVSFLDSSEFQAFLHAYRENEIEYQNGNELYEQRTALVDAACGVREMDRHEVNSLLHTLLTQSRSEGKAYARICDAKRRMWDALFERVSKHNDGLESDCDSAEIATYSVVKEILQAVVTNFGCSLY